MIYVEPKDAEFYSTLIEKGLTTYESQDGLTAHIIYDCHTYELQLEEVSDDKYILLYIKEVK